MNRTHKTRVYWDPVDVQWVCDYVLPYSGRLTSMHDSWDDAMEQAWSVERERLWL